MTLNYRDKAIYLLSQGFAPDFCKYVSQSDRFSELIMEMADEFVESEIPVRGEENRTEVAFELVTSLKLIVDSK